jgi:hypothetical protein
MDKWEEVCRGWVYRQGKALDWCSRIKEGLGHKCPWISKICKAKELSQEKAKAPYSCIRGLRLLERIII